MNMLVSSGLWEMNNDVSTDAAKQQWKEITKTKSDNVFPRKSVRIHSKRGKTVPSMWELKFPSHSLATHVGYFVL
jgi:hypothetical protein